MKTAQKLLLAVALLSCNASFAQNGSEGSKTLSDMEKAWMQYMQPGEMHAMLAKSNGMWTEQMEMWMAPGQPSVASTATVSNKMILGGRYQQGNHVGKVQGMPFEGISTVGYDNAKKKFISTWVDNMGTGVMYAEGDWNDNEKSIEFKGKQVDPLSGNELPWRETFRIIDNDTQQMEMYMTTPDGQEYKSMSILLKRASQKDGTPVKPAAPAKTGEQKKPATPPAKK